MKKKKARTKNIKIKKGKSSLVKANTVKVVNQPHIKLVGRLKDKSCKIIYIHNT